ncbi:hypothetical protein [Paenibacillus pinisoli]|uniref:hypothetical protein n=1 Tax=Paenibacillus pinisoli TaxID=1276110 RepID=UPI001402B89F|nr:hypothetical protein [Paenibacillus pinisoli]
MLQADFLGIEPAERARVDRQAEFLGLELAERARMEQQAELYGSVYALRHICSCLSC